MNPGAMMASREGTKARRTDSVPIPNGWDLRRLKHVGMVVSGTGFPHEYQGNENEELPFLKVSDMSAAGSEKWVSRAANSVSRETARELGASVVPENSVVYAKIGAALLLNKRRLLTNPSCIDNNMSAFVPRAVVPQWALWWMSTLDFGEYVNPGAIPSFTEGQQKELPFLVPPTETQRLIADYLDRETARIDALVAEKEKMLALLEEKRATLISRAVTRGLDSTAPLKPSGLDWLGDIPAHWEVWKLKYVVEKIGSGITPRGGAESYQSEGIPLFRSQNIHFDGLRMDDIVYVDAETHESMSNSKVFEGDVLINITGASIGRCFYIESLQGEANVNQHVCIVRPAPNIETKFLYFTLRSDVGQHQIDLSQSGSGREGLNFESLGNFSIVIPPLSEQLAIIQRLEMAGNRSTELLNEIRNSLERLKERRAALITAAVTGQIPVEEMRI